MSLKMEIDRTEIEKNKTKKALVNTNNALKNVGAQIAQTHADVADKITSFAKDVRKIAILKGFLQGSERQYDQSKYSAFYIVRPSVDFKIERAVVYWEYYGDYGTGVIDIHHVADSKFNFFDEIDNKKYNPIEIREDNSLKIYMSDKYRNGAYYEMLLYGK